MEGGSSRRGEKVASSFPVAMLLAHPTRMLYKNRLKDGTRKDAATAAAAAAVVIQEIEETQAKRMFKLDEYSSTQHCQATATAIKCMCIFLPVCVCLHTRGTRILSIDDVYLL